MSEQGGTGPEHLKFVKFRFGFIARPLLLQILEVMHCKKCTRVVVFSQSLWVNVIPGSKQNDFAELLRAANADHRAVGESS